MSKGVKIILLIVLVIGGLWGEKIVDLVKNNVEIVLPSPTPTVPIDEPSIAFKSAVLPISELYITPADASQISNFFLELASVVKNDPGFIVSTSIFREFNITSGGLNFAGTTLKNKYPNLGEMIDTTIVLTVGKESVPLDPAKRSDLVDCLKAIAWAVHQ